MKYDEVVRLAELERVNLEKQKKQEEQDAQKQEEEEAMQRMMTRNKYDD